MVPGKILFQDNFFESVINGIAFFVKLALHHSMHQTAIYGHFQSISVDQSKRMSLEGKIFTVFL